MSVKKVVTSTLMAATLLLGVAGCGAGYTGEGVLINKEAEQKNKTTSTKKSSKISYKLTLDVPNSDIDQIFTVSKSKYDAVKLGETIKVEKGSVK